MKKSKGSTKKSKPAAGTSGEGRPSLEDLLTDLRIAHWDFLIVGDGSGSNWERGVGWASVSIERVTGERLVWAGATNRGTVNLAEMMAYMQPLTFFASREEDRRQDGLVKRRAYNVHIITDSQYCRDTGASRAGGQAKNGGLWSAFTAFQRQGFVLHWHWIRRATCGLNEYCDDLGRLARIVLEERDLVTEMDGRKGDVYAVTPSSE
jgi:ribonuclease HI